MKTNDYFFYIKVLWCGLICFCEVSSTQDARSVLIKLACLRGLYISTKASQGFLFVFLFTPPNLFFYNKC